jgi:hypothetical protein
MRTTAMAGYPFAYFTNTVSEGALGSISTSGMRNIDTLSNSIERYHADPEVTVENIINQFHAYSYPTADQVRSVISELRITHSTITDNQMRALERELFRRYRLNYDLMRSNEDNESVLYQLICRSEVSVKGPTETLRLVRGRSEVKQEGIEAYAKAILARSPKLRDMSKVISREQMESLEGTFVAIREWRQGEQWRFNDGSSILANNPEAVMDPVKKAPALVKKAQAPVKKSSVYGLHVFDEEDEDEDDTPSQSQEGDLEALMKSRTPYIPGFEEKGPPGIDMDSLFLKPYKYYHYKGSQGWGYYHVSSHDYNTYDFYGAMRPNYTTLQQLIDWKVKYIKWRPPFPTDPGNNLTYYKLLQAGGYVYKNDGDLGQGFYLTEESKGGMRKKMRVGTKKTKRKLHKVHSKKR